MKKILIVSGDPNSINSEIIFKSWKKINNSLKKQIYFISNFKLINSQFKKFGYKTKIENVKNIEENANSNGMKIINVDINFKDPFNVPLVSSRRFIIRSLNLGHKLSLNENVLGIINCSINKRLLGDRMLGVTEFFASKCGIKNNSEVMLIWNKKLSVCPITTHINIKRVSQKLNEKLIINKIKTINLWFKKNFKKNPKFGVLGLNPHNAELRNNSEEKKIIIPAINKLKKKKIKIVGPLVADTIFINDYKKYNIIIGMFHDQVLGPFKSIFKFNAVNITLGLKYLRVSPDHGTAVNLIGKNKANITSFLQCIKIIKMLKK
tara:strand:- start:305 stop:1267 length:963 start_codon:yes stop_codon:yes gene_type:complete